VFLVIDEDELDNEVTMKCWGRENSNIDFYESNSISKLQIQVANYVFELSAGNCHR
jgi:hypothetical protein